MPSIQWTLARVFSFVLYYSGGLWLYERLERRRRPGPHCMVVFYHRIASVPCGYRDVAVDPKTFRSHLDYMVSRGYRFLTLEAYQEYLSGHSSLQGDSILLTFDDGYRDNYTAAFPSLLELSIPATIFLCTGPMEDGVPLWWDRVARVAQSLRGDRVRSLRELDEVPPEAADLLFRSLVGNDRKASTAIAGLIDWLKSRPADDRERIIATLESETQSTTESNLMLTWEMVREMRAAGIDFGAHSVTHPVFSQLGQEEALAEILESKRCIEGHLGSEVTAFAYPYGKSGYFDASTIESVRSSGLSWAYTTENGMNEPGSDPYTLRRNGMRDVPRYLLAVRLAGVFEHPVLCRLRSWLEMRRPA